MAEIDVRNWENVTVRRIELDDRVFAYPLKEHLIHEAVCAYRAGGRRGTHQTKNRKEVAGGTRKLWRQKHTGRARMGDNRSPLWRHGGTVHGPHPRDYAWGLPRRMRRCALKSALAQKLRDGKLMCLEGLEVPTPKTGALEALIAGVGVTGRTLLLAEEAHRNLELAARNNPRLTVVRALGASIVDLVGHDTIIASEPALRELMEVLAR